MRKRVVIGDIIAVFVLILAGLVWAEVPGDLEGRYFPVITPLTLERNFPSPPPAYRTKWTGSAEKLRKCNFVAVEWFLGPRHGRRVQVTAEFTDPPEVRGTGRLEWAGLVITLDPQETLNNSHADVLHDCGWPWLTRTPFFDGD